VAIAAGVFTMGDNAALSQAGPEHPVMLSAYAIDKTEVTNDAYRMCVAAGACPLPSNTTQYSDSAKSNVPVVYVDLASATAYCAWAGKRLPTEAEWEKAARGTDKRKYPWGAATASCALANGGVGTLMNGQCQLGVVAVGSYPDGASPYGVLDLSGNAREWVYDWDGTYPSASSMVTDPGGPQTGSKRQTRGGSYFSLPEQLTTAARLAHAPEDSVDSIGFRCARGPTPRPKVVPTAVLTVTPTVGSTSTVFNADASQSTDPIDAAATLQVRWKFGDGDVFGPFTTAKTTTHHYAANGSYPLTVEVRNSNGYTAQAVRTVTVNANGSPPDMAGGAGEGQSCATDTDCVVPLYCYQGQCRQICGFIGGSCPAGFTCSDQVFGYCLPTGG